MKQNVKWRICLKHCKCIQETDVGGTIYKQHENREVGEGGSAEATQARRPMGRLSASIGDLRCAEEAVYCSRSSGRGRIRSKAHSSWSASASASASTSMLVPERRLTEDEQWEQAENWVLRQDKETLRGSRRIFRRFRNMRWWPACLR